MKQLYLITLLTAMNVFVLINVQAQPKILQAIKGAVAPKIDGVLDDAVWNNVLEATDFVTNAPFFGKSPTVKTSVKVIYDNNALYVGAFIYEKPSLIRKQFTVRDNTVRADVDYFSVFIDTYKDRQNAYQFQVSARNVQTDSRLSPTIKSESDFYGDLGWDAVWDSKVAMNADGWSVEIKIPYFTLRFARMPVQDWGINFLLTSRHYNEMSFWNPVNPNENGFVNQFGDLTGLADLKPPSRLSFSPYVSTGFSRTPQAAGKNINEWLRSGGMDVKYGLNESFTLDATLIPDFGQVVSDNLINNITPFEQQFRENRPFFTEGTELFSKAGIFYTRRIGHKPDGYYDVQGLGAPGGMYDIKKNPSVTQLYNAIKFSGRNKNNLGIGIFNAVTKPEKAIVRNKLTNKDSTIITEQLANYNVFVLDQALKNRSYITFTNTNVVHCGGERNANVTALDLVLFDKTNRYSVGISPRWSKVFGKESYDGGANEVTFGKVSGNWQWNIINRLRSEKYDPTELGFMRYANQFINLGEISYNIFKANKYFLNQRYAFNVEQSHLFKPMLYQKTEFKPSAFVILKNFWDLHVEVPICLWYNDYFWYNTFYDPTSKARKLRRSPYYSFFLGGSSDSRKRLFLGWDFGFAEGPLPDDPYYAINIEARYRFNERFSLSVAFGRQQDKAQWGWAQDGKQFILDNNNEPILARRKYTDVSNVLSGTYSFASRMNFTFRARHYWNRILNRNFYYPQSDGNWKERFDYIPSQHNANVNYFNLDAFYTWDFRLGSRVIIAYKNALGNDFTSSLPENSNKGFLKNGYKSIFALPHSNEFSIRFIYFINYLDRTICK